MTDHLNERQKIFFCLGITGLRPVTNSSYLSRAINEGLGINFSAFVAGLRCDAVFAALRAGSMADLLTLALDAGFGFKASFNRAFQAKFGESPLSYRKRHASIQE